MNPIFSIIIPLYNRELAIIKAINSVLNQSFVDFELIIIDDCSSDNSINSVQQFLDKRILLLRNEKNLGAAAARNKGIQASRGAFISLLDSDDDYEPNFLQESYNKISNTPSNVGFMWSGLKIIEGSQIKEEIWKPKIQKTVYQTFLKELRIGTNAGIVIKKIVFDKIGFFNEKLPAAEDTDFFLRVTKEYDFVINDKILINIYKSGDDRLSKNFKKIALAYNIFLPEHFPVILNDKFLKRKFFYKLMWLNFYIPNKKNSRYYFKELLKDKNLSIKIIFIYMLFEIFPLNFSKRIHSKGKY